MWSPRPRRGHALLGLLGTLLASGACTVDGAVSARATIGRSGGSLRIAAADDLLLAGTQLDIPPGALQSDTLVTIARGKEQAFSREQAMSPSIRVSPDGLTLTAPASLFMPYVAAEQQRSSMLLVRVTSAGVPSEQRTLLASPAAGLVRIDLAHFSDYELVAEPCPRTDLGAAPADLGADPAPDGGYAPAPACAE